MNQNLCDKIGVLGIRRGKAFWNEALDEISGHEKTTSSHNLGTAGMQPNLQSDVVTTVTCRSEIIIIIILKR